MTQQNNFSEDELEQLDSLLLTNEEAMAIDELHGYLCALIISHQPLTDEVILETVCAAASELHQKSRTLILKLKEQIALELSSSEPFEPLYIEVDDDEYTYLDYEGWCHGFMFGLSQLDMDWENTDNKVKDLIAPISSIALAEEDEETELSDDEYEDLIEMIPGSIAGLYNYWHQ